jgi:hypothetical protein
MTKILVGIFLGVFIGTLGYELVSRNNPEAIERIRKKVSEKVDDFIGSEETGELEA